MPLPTALLAVAVLLAACGGSDDRLGDRDRDRNAAAAPSALDGRLMNAARDGRANDVRRLLARGAHPSARDANGATALVLASYGNHVEAARARSSRRAPMSTPRTTRSRART